MGTVQLFTPLESKFDFFGVFCLLCPFTGEHQVLKLLYILTFFLLMFISLSAVFNNHLYICVCVNDM